jgi:hypothetical protein
MIIKNVLLNILQALLIDYEEQRDGLVLLVV